MMNDEIQESVTCLFSHECSPARTDKKFSRDRPHHPSRNGSRVWYGTIGTIVQQPRENFAPYKIRVGDDVDDDVDDDDDDDTLRSPPRSCHRFSLKMKPKVDALSRSTCPIRYTFIFLPFMQT